MIKKGLKVKVLTGRDKKKEGEVIEVFALAYMRGMNIDNSILIFEIELLEIASL